MTKMTVCQRFSLWVAELRAVSGLFNGINQRLRAGAARHMGFSEGDFRLLNVRPLLSFRQPMTKMTVNSC